MTSSDTSDASSPPPPDDRPDDPPVPAAARLEDREPPESEAERQARETLRSVSRLEESN